MKRQEPLPVAVFQFHKGAIRTAGLNPYLAMQNEFQFHKGAIRTPSRFFDALSDRYFNSIKVRLERIGIRSINTTHIFQFHKGAIRTLRISI